VVLMALKSRANLAAASAAGLVIPVVQPVIQSAAARRQTLGVILVSARKQTLRSGA
jgi:hypothetical protein